MWTEKSLKEKIIENKGFCLEGALTELLPLALDITEDPKKIPYVFTEISSDSIDKVQVAAFPPEDLASALTVQNYHAMLNYLKEECRRRPETISSQKNNGFKMMIDFNNDGKPTRDVSHLFSIYTSVHDSPYCLSLSSSGEGYNAFSGPSKIRLEIRCEDFMGPNKHTFT